MKWTVGYSSLPSQEVLQSLCSPFIMFFSVFRSIKVADNVVFIYKSKKNMLSMCVLCLSLFLITISVKMLSSCKNAFFFLLSIFIWMCMLTCTHVCPYIHVHCRSSCSACVAYTIQLPRTRVCSYVHVHCHTSYSDCVYDPAPTDLFSPIFVQTHTEAV